MTREEHDKIFTEFYKNTIKHSPLQDYLDDQWALAVRTGVHKNTPESLEKALQQNNEPNYGKSKLIESLLTCLVSSKTIVRCSPKVSNYLDSHHELAGILPAICLLAKHEFKDEAQLSLEVYDDPEFEDEHLCLYVRQENYEKGLMERIRRISKVSEKMIRSISGDIDITSDGHPPI